MKELLERLDREGARYILIGGQAMRLSGLPRHTLGGPGLPPFDAAFARAVVRRTEEDIPARCLCDEDLEAAKVAAGRPQDVQDIEFLRAKRSADATGREGAQSSRDSL